MSNKTLNDAYATLTSYVKRVGYGKNIDTNTLRSKLSEVRGLSPNQYGGIISAAVRNGFIYRVGETVSNDPNHNSGRVGIYRRGL